MLGLTIFFVSRYTLAFTCVYDLYRIVFNEFATNANWGLSVLEKIYKVNMYKPYNLIQNQGNVVKHLQNQYLTCNYHAILIICNII